MEIDDDDDDALDDDDDDALNDDDDDKRTGAVGAGQLKQNK